MIRNKTCWFTWVEDRFVDSAGNEIGSTIQSCNRWGSKCFHAFSCKLWVNAWTCRSVGVCLGTTTFTITLGIWGILQHDHTALDHVSFSLLALGKGGKGGGKGGDAKGKGDGKDGKGKRTVNPWRLYCGFSDMWTEFVGHSYDWRRDLSTCQQSNSFGCAKKWWGQMWFRWVVWFSYNHTISYVSKYIHTITYRYIRSLPGAHLCLLFQKNNDNLRIQIFGSVWIHIQCDLFCFCSSNSPIRQELVLADHQHPEVRSLGCIIFFQCHVFVKGKGKGKKGEEEVPRHRGEGWSPSKPRMVPPQSVEGKRYRRSKEVIVRYDYWEGGDNPD